MAPDKGWVIMQVNFDLAYSNHVFTYKLSIKLPLGEGCVVHPRPLPSFNKTNTAAARQRSKSLDGGWSEDSLWRAIRIRAFPRNAVMDRKVFKTEINVNWPYDPGSKSGQQINSPTTFSCPSPVKFCAAIPKCKISVCSLATSWNHWQNYLV